MESQSQTMAVQMEESVPKSLQTNECEDNYDSSITIEVQVSSDQTNCETSFGSLLIPGYLLVRSPTDSGAYHLQQTVMQIDVGADQTNNDANTGIVQSIDSSVDSNQVSITRTLEQMIVSNGSVDIIGDNNGLNENSVEDNNESKGNIKNRKTYNKSNKSIETNKKNSVLIENNEKVRKNNNKSISNRQTNERTLRKKNNNEGMAEKNVRHLPPSRLARVECPVCNKEFKKTYLKEHMKIHENSRDYKCLTCGKTYRWRTLLRNHKKTHLANNPFTCPVCDLRMSSKFSVQQHVLKVHENADKRFKCSKCDKKYVTIHQLRAHEKFHSEDRTRQCEYCGKVYKHIASLERHRRLHKGEENSLDLRLKCSSCGLICHSKTHYTAHQRIHTGEKPFVCETCGKTYRQIAQLNQHKIVHTDLRPFKCTICERTFRCRSNLQLHLDHHKGEKRHTCSHCKQKFFSYPNMLKHIRRNHLGLRPFKCNLCENKSFCEKQELQNHMRTHTGEKRPTPKRKRLPLPVPENQKSTQIVLKMKSLPSSDSTQTITQLVSQTDNDFTNCVENTIIYEISETD